MISAFSFLKPRVSSVAWAAAAWMLAAAAPAGAAGTEALGASTGLPVPRFVSLKSDRVNLREGPSMDHRTAWIFQRAGLPVEVMAEFDVWRRIRDSEGTEGWVQKSLLSGRRTALVSPWKKGGVFAIRAKPKEDAGVAANVQAGVVANIKTCDAAWCHIFGDGYDGYIEQTSLWGVYPDEKL
jgi:SH3-like domain-containing protein